MSGFIAEIIHRSTEINCVQIQNCSQLMLMEGLENHDELVCANHDT